jgi:acyl-CoA thioester hydrolase
MCLAKPILPPSDAACHRSSIALCARLETGVSRFVAVTPPPRPFVHRLRVRYIECDMQGIVFNSHYYAWMDLAHQELIREVLGPLDVLHALGADVVVAESSARYFASARFDQEIDIEVRLDGLGTTSMNTGYTFRNGETVLAEGRVRHVCVHPELMTKTPWPDEVRAAFTPLLEGSG